jgi:hypothetical protein
MALRKDLRLPVVAAAATLLLHLLGNAHYGFFRDELYFIICGRHPAWGYVDQPALVPLLSAATQVFGISLFALRALPALFAAGGVFVVCRIVQELRGGAFAQILAAICVALSPVLCSFGTKVGTDMPGLWLWPLAALYVLRLAKGADPRWWLGVGIALGIAGNAKYSVLFFAIALFVGLALSPQRRILATPWCAAGCAAALLLVAPNVAWQAVHHFPMLELLRNGANGKNVIVGPGVYLIQELYITGPLLAIVWILGVVRAFVDRELRWIGWTYVLLIAMMIALHGKHYYPGNVYPIVFAAGAAAIGSWTARSRAIRIAIVACALAAALPLVPLVLPILPEAQMVTYNQRLASMIHVNLNTEHHKGTAIGSDYADMHGWPELAATVARVYEALPPRERAQAAIAASNYGEAAAIDFFGTKYGLPPALSGHNQYWLWGPRGFSGNVLVDVNGDCGAGMHLFKHAALAARAGSGYAQSYEIDIPIMVCRGITKPLASIWPMIKDYN